MSDTLKIIAFGICAALFLFVAWAVVFEDKKACNEKGGVLVRQAGDFFKLSCVREIKL